MISNTVVSAFIASLQIEATRLQVEDMSGPRAAVLVRDIWWYLQILDTMRKTVAYESLHDELQTTSNELTKLLSVLTPKVEQFEREWCRGGTPQPNKNE